MSGRYKVIERFYDQESGRYISPPGYFDPNSHKQAQRLLKAGCLIFAEEDKKKEEKVRIYEISKELGYENHVEVIKAAQKLGYEVSSHSSTVTGEEAEKIKEKLGE